MLYTLFIILTTTPLGKTRALLRDVPYLCLDVKNTTVIYPDLGTVVLLSVNKAAYGILLKDAIGAQMHGRFCTSDITQVVLGY